MCNGVSTAKRALLSRSESQCCISNEVAMSGPVVAVSPVRAPSVFRIHDKVRVLVVDDHPLLREGIAAVLTGKSDLTIVGEAGDGAEAIEQFRALQPDVTVM